ncbi:kinetochore-associated Ndc80 complex subunit ndc80 [Marasmius crinis-equi]|uniref:Kinetochore protein NDC80 n=1 Tax=Marasmius crinis-equi TaxID=585013 RepID=A0ABR3FYI3_9AGAR
MMDSRRRSVMPPGSSLPVPATIKKPAPTPNASSRMSLSGPAIRGPYPIPPNMNPRQSLMRSQGMGVNPLLQSASKSALGRTPGPPNSARRGSIWAGAPPQPSSSQSKDPRPLRDKNFQARERAEIHSYLKDNPPQDFTLQKLTNVTGKDYRIIFEHLVQIISPMCLPEEQTRFEDVFIPTLKALRYPWVGALDNKWLAAPASMHSWPSLLGVLHWLVEICKMTQDYLDSSHPTLQDPSLVPEEFEDPNHYAALALDYYQECYLMWLDHVDEFVEANQQIEERYARKNERSQQDLDTLTTRLHEAMTELKKLTDSPAPIARVLDDNKTINGDYEKMRNILQQWNARKIKLTEAIAAEKNELARLDQELTTSKTEQARLQKIVQDQNLSPEEVHRMNSDHENLQRNLEDLRHKKSDIHRSVMKLEVSLTHSTSRAEECLDLYTNLLSKLDLFPPLPHPHEDVDLTFELNSAAQDTRQLLLGPDVRKVVKPVLNHVAESKRRERAELESERIKLDNDLDKMIMEFDTSEDEINQEESKVKSVNDEAESLHATSQQEGQQAAQQLARLERDLSDARTAALASGMGVKSRLQSLQFEYNETTAKINRLKDELIRGILKNSNEIAEFKGEVSRHLQELKDFAEIDS